ncbi:hypothetical protein AG0111_0g799 [Alternaria gaisen]|uniref:Uncharacterized protein n=1 Tax=Alternaria gaisen TaxID=167740 RepID=A0ACB6G313_9PLEO|nr:hypothetical protein AG0111_0g799 [Alternaria gaisen]
MPWDPPSYQSHSFERPHQALAAYEAASPPNIVSQSDDEFLHLATDWIPGASSTVQPRTQTLQKPVVIPRLDVSGLLGTPFPFIRAYSSDLRSFNILEKDFVAFLDNLSVAQAPPVPLQALDTAGHVVGIVPHHWAVIAGTSMNMVAGIGTAATTRTRTSRFLETANREYFAPRGLKVSIYKERQLAERLHYDLNMPPLAPLSSSSLPQTAGYRRLQVLMPHIAPLSFNVSPPMEQRNALDRLAAKQIERRIRKKEDSYSSDSSMSSVSSASSISSTEDFMSKPRAELNSREKRKADKAERKREKKEEKRRRRERKRTRKQDRRDTKAHGKPNKRMEKDQKTVAKMEYIVVESLHALA